MFDAAWDWGCDGCTVFLNELGDFAMRNERSTQFVLISLGDRSA